MRALVIPLLLATACPSKNSPGPTTPTPTTNPTSSPVVATLERTACFGFCPIYKVAVRRDGTVEWHGERFVKVVGPATGTIAPDALTRLEDAFGSVDYGQLADEYTNMEVTDLPTVITSYTIEADTKTVRHYHGDRSAPDELRWLEDEIDRILETEKWIGTEAEREQLRSKWR